jgi:hypothetical protein
MSAGTLVMSGTTPSYGRWPTSAGTALVIGTSTFAFLHRDWLGNSRIVSSVTGNNVVADQAYTPYGEIYDVFGGSSGEYQAFADITADFAPSTTTPIMWDTPNRELSYAGRWLSPDPAGVGWNLYAYSTNPSGTVDPNGLSPQIYHLGSSEGADWADQASSGDFAGTTEAFGTVAADADSAANTTPSDTSGGWPRL